MLRAKVVGQRKEGRKEGKLRIEGVRGGNAGRRGIERETAVQL